MVTPDGSRPTHENSVPLDGRDGQGSCMWFNQASMFQTSELGFATVWQAKDAGAPTFCNAQSLIDKGLFPKVVSAA